MVLYIHVKALFRIIKGVKDMANRRKDNKGRVLKKGESQRKDLVYMYRWTDRNGERQTIYAGTLEDLREQEEKIQFETLQGVCRKNLTFGDLIERYLATKASLASSTESNYRYYYEHSIKDEAITKMKVIDVKKSDLLLFYKKKSSEGLSNGTIRILHKIIHPALELAVDDDMLYKNPAKGCMKEYPVQDEVKYALTFEQENEFLERISIHPRIKRYYPLYATMLYTGLRVSEIIGLTWEDIDFKNKTISVNHQLQYRTINGKATLYCIDLNKGESKPRTKTPSGVRVIPMSKKVYALLQEWKKEWMKMKKDSYFQVDGYKSFVFLSHVSGRNHYPANIRHSIDRIVAMNKDREIKLPHIAPHILRHTACTRFAEAGMDIKIVQYLMGHSDIKTTIKVYNHADVERAKRAMEKLNEFQEKYTNPYTDFCNKDCNYTAFRTPITTPITTPMRCEAM